MSELAPLADGLSAALRMAWIEIDLDALERNLALLRRSVRPAGVLAVVKADAYGHGAPEVARALAASQVDWLGVAFPEEGAQIRRCGVQTPILVLGTTTFEQLPLFARYDLTPAVSSLTQLGLWEQWAESPGPTMRVHLKVDVGMHRLGLAPDELPSALLRLHGRPRLVLGGLLSHLTEADNLASPRTEEQESRFLQLVDTVRTSGVGDIALHLANSAAALHHPGTRQSFVRTGLALYGLDPAGREPGLQSVMSVRSRIVQLTRVPVGARVGYGGTWTAERETRLAVVPVGYGDGYPWRLSNRAEVLVKKGRLPVVGVVNMDMTLVDVTDSPAELGDEVVFLGQQGDEHISARELAEKAGTIPYEILCHFGLRLPRRYCRGGRVVEEESRFTVRQS